MADFEEPKGFAFGDLNPVSEPRTAKKFDSKHTSALGAMREVVVGHYTPDALANTGPYKGVVLRVEEDMDQNNPAPGNWLSTIFGKQGMMAGLNPFSVPKKLKQYKVRIPELHSTLPIPDRYAASPSEVGTHQKIIDMYPTFVSKDSNTEQASAGDLVWVDFGHKGNMEDPTFLGPVFPPPESGGGGQQGGGGKDAFDCPGGALGAGGNGTAPSGGSITPAQNTKKYGETASTIPGQDPAGGTNAMKDTQNPETHWYFPFKEGEKPSDWDIVNFTPDDCKSGGDGVVAMNKETLRALDKAASRYEEMGHPPIQLTNMVEAKRNGGYRDPAYNKKNGGSKKSRHMFGDGFDIWTYKWTDQQRINILINLYAAGFRGFGHGVRNIHADTGKKRQWDYGGYGKVAWKLFDGRNTPSPIKEKLAEPAPAAAESTPAPAEEKPPQITAENITKDQALAVALTDDEKAEVNAAADIPAIAATVAGKRAIEKSASENKAEATPAASSTAAAPASSTPSQSHPPANCQSGGGGGGGGGGGRGAQNIAHLSTGEPIGGVDFVGTTAADPFGKMGRVKVPMDKIPHPTKDKSWYVGTARVREDVAPNVSEVKRILNELGCFLPSSGASRELNFGALTAGHSATSFHYTSAALDILLPSMMSRLDTTDNFLVEFDPSREGKFIVWARSGLTSGSVSKGGVTFEVEHKTLQAIKATGGQPPKIVPTQAYAVNLTKLMWAHGLKDIGARSTWYKNCTGASEAWHFDFRENMGLVKGQSRYDDVLKTMFDPGPEPPWSYGAKTWNGGSFSDLRLKSSVSHIGTSPSGIPKYTFIYKYDNTNTRYHGVMAQDIMQTHPEAVVLDASGYYKVNYNLIDVDFHAV